VVVDREPLRLRLRCGARALGHRLVQVAAVGRPVIAGHADLAPAEVVRGRDVREEVEALDVTQMRAGLAYPGGIDYERRLAEREPGLDEAGDALVGTQLATPRIS
jgi:hypothetical protein